MTRTLTLAALLLTAPTGDAQVAVTAVPAPPVPDGTGGLLPHGAVARLGDFSKRFSPTQRMTFSADGELVIRTRDSGTEVRETRTGRDVTPPWLRDLTPYIVKWTDRYVVVWEQAAGASILDPTTGEVAVPRPAELSSGALAFAISGRNTDDLILMAPGVGAWVCDGLDRPKPVWRSLKSFPMNCAYLHLIGAEHRAISRPGDAVGKWTLIDLRADRELDAGAWPELKMEQGNHIWSAVPYDDGLVVSSAGKLHRLAVSADKLVHTPGVGAAVETHSQLVGADPDGATVWSQSLNTRELVRLAVNTGQAVDRLPLPDEHAGSPNYLHLSPCGRWVAAYSQHSIPTVTDRGLARPAFEYPELEPVSELVPTGPAGAVVLTAHTFRRWAVAGRDATATPGWATDRRNKGRLVYADPDGRTVGLTRATADGHEVVLRNLETGVETFTAAVHPHWTRAVRVVPAGRFNLLNSLPVDGRSNSWSAFPVGGGPPVGLPLAPGVVSVAASADGRLLLVQDASQCGVYELATGRPRLTRPFVVTTQFDGRNAGAEFYQAAFAADGRHIVRSTSTGHVELWSLADAAVAHERRFTSMNTVRAVGMSADGRWLAVAEPGGGVRVWDWRADRLRTRDIRIGRGSDYATHVAFSTDGQYLFTGGQDGTVLVWNTSWFESASRVTPKAWAAGELWDRLADDDAAAAGVAVHELARRGDDAVALLAERLPPAGRVSPLTVHALVAALGSNVFADREAAENALARVGEQALPSVRAAADGGSAEVRARAGRVLAQLGWPIHGPDRVRVVRAVEVVERIGTPAARDLLAAWAAGADAALLTTEARTAVERVLRSGGG